MSTAPDEPLSTPGGDAPDEQEAPPVTEPDVEGDDQTVAPDPVENA